MRGGKRRNLNVERPRGRKQRLKRLVQPLEERIAALEAKNRALVQLRKQVEAAEQWKPALHPLRQRLAALEATKASDRIARLETLAATWPEPFEPVERSGELAASPLVSVIMPTRNRSALIGTAIGSVIAQSFTDWELLVIDDGGDDDTADIVAGFADTRIRYLRQEPAGAGAARNHGLRIAAGAFVAYLDSDNRWYPSFLAAAVRGLAERPEIGAVYGALAREEPQPGAPVLLWEPFDRERLLQKNYIDINTLVHRKALADDVGGFDETLERLIDWDFVLRLTRDSSAVDLPVLAAQYPANAGNRITKEELLGPSYLKVRRKWQGPAAVAGRLRVLYVLWHYPQLSESYVETEILCMLRWGVEIAVWCETDAAAPYPASVPVHRGPLAEAISTFRPHLLHVHWLHVVRMNRADLEKAELPITVRAHGFEFNGPVMKNLLNFSLVRRVYMFPHQMRSVDATPKLKAVNAAFDTQLFVASAQEKDPRLVVRTAAALPAKDLTLIFELAKRCPDHRFVLVVATAKSEEAYVDTLREAHLKSGTPAELFVDLQRDDIAAIVGQAGIYLHTAVSPNRPGGTPIGMPISIAEAMATGAWLLVRNLPPLLQYVEDAGSGYRNIEDAAQQINATASWDAAQWRDVQRRSIDRAYVRFADELSLRPIFEDWLEIAGEKRQSATADAG